jgi:hypothetical protein
MLRFLAAAMAVTAAGALAGCNTMTATAYQVPAGPNPPPPPGYRVECTSTHLPIWPDGSYFATGCQQILAPTRSDVVIRARG